jgi:hypothetical protein
MSEAMGSAADESYDFSDAGLQESEEEFVVTEFTVAEKDNGTQHLLKLETEAIPYPIYLNAWVKHTNPKAAQVGRSILKRFALAALGQPGYNQNTIVGARVLATVKEDENGFARVSKFKPAPAAETVTS